MTVLKIEVIGVVPPCSRCKKTEENVRKAAAKLSESGFKVEVTKLDVTSRETISRYGLVISPAIAVNGVLKTMGRIPEPGFIERILRSEMNSR